MTEIYGTIGPACAAPEILRAMFSEGMTGMRLNTSHISVKEAAPQIEMIHDAAAACGVHAKLLIDMQGPELRIGKLAKPLLLAVGDHVCFGGDVDDIPVPEMVLKALQPGLEVLLDDGRILLKMTDTRTAAVERGGKLLGGKSIALNGTELTPPAMT